MSDTARMKAILVLAGAAAFAASPFLNPGFGGFDPDRFPVPQVDPPVQPAGYAFSIWGLIYLWLLAHGGYGLFRRADAADWDRGRWPLLVSLAVGAAWLPVALLSPVWAMVLIWVMLVAALVALFRAPERDVWLARAPLGVYAGWLTAAAWVSVALVGAGFGVAFGEVAWAWIALVAALVMAAAVLSQLRWGWSYAAAVVWALVAMAVANFAGDTALAVAALGGAGAVAGYAVVVRRNPR